MLRACLSNLSQFFRFQTLMALAFMPTPGPLMKKLFLPLVCLLVCATPLPAALKYWDINGASAGAGGATPAGTWSSSAANTSTDSTGSSATAAWPSSADTAVFSAGTDATGTFIVSVPSAITASGITVEEGTVQKASGSAAITIGTGAITISNGATFSIDGSTAISASSGATLTLDGSTMENRTTGSAGSFVSTVIVINVTTNGGILSYPSAGVLNIVQTGTPGTIISGPGGITKVGAGVLAISTACTYTGPTIINASELRIRNTSNRLPTGTAVNCNSPGKLNLNNVVANPGGQ